MLILVKGIGTSMNGISSFIYLFIFFILFCCWISIYLFVWLLTNIIFLYSANARVVESPPYNPSYNGFDMNNSSQPGPSRLLQLFSAARTFKPSSLLDGYRRSLLNGLGASSYDSHTQIAQQHTGEVIGNPVDSNSGNQHLYHPGGRSSAAYDSRLSSHASDVQRNDLHDDFPDMYGNNVEEEMIQAALEASKRDAEEVELNQLQEVDELSRAVSLSLKVCK